MILALIIVFFLVLPIMWALLKFVFGVTFGLVGFIFKLLLPLVCIGAALVFGLSFLGILAL